MKSSASPTPSTSSFFSFRSAHSPLPPPAYSVNCMSAAAKRYKFLRRLFKFNQMDFEFAMWQMLYLFIAPQKVYRNFYYRKQTKSQFARDDPAFLVLLLFWFFVSSIGLAVVLGLSFGQYLLLTLYVIFVDCLAVGVCVATGLWFLTNRFLKKETCFDQDVEWGFAFDVHLNAFFPPLIILHIFQMIFYNWVIHYFWIGRLFGNSMWFIAVAYYFYITFLGYSSLPILGRTQVLLYPLAILFLVFVVATIGGWNIAPTLVHFYRHRVMYRI